MGNETQGGAVSASRACLLDHLTIRCLLISCCPLPHPSPPSLPAAERAAILRGIRGDIARKEVVNKSTAQGEFRLTQKELGVRSGGGGGGVICKCASGATA